MRRARFRGTVNLASAQQRRRGGQDAETLQGPEKESPLASPATDAAPPSSPVTSTGVIGVTGITPLPSSTADAAPTVEADGQPSAVSGAKPPMIRPKPRFKPNLSSPDVLARGRLRKLSESSDCGSDLPLPAVVAATATPAALAEEAASPAKDAQRETPTIKKRKVSTEPPPDEEKRIVKEPTIFDQRRADHKKKFNVGKVPERTKITMFDLIYYNPSDGNRMSVDSRGTSSRSNSTDSRRNSVVSRVEEEEVDDPGMRTPPKKEEEVEEDALPVPQVKVGADGSIIIDEDSTLISTTAAKKAKVDLLNSPLVFESTNRATNYGSWGKKRKNVDWTERETVRFFKALSVFGTDFSMMEKVFKRRSRQDLKLKFKKEDRTNRQLVDRCLAKGLKFDASFFDNDSEQEENEAELARAEKENKLRMKREEKTKKVEERRKARLEAKKNKKRVRKVKTKRGYYSSSSEAEAEAEADGVTPSTEGPSTRQQTRAKENSPMLKAILDKNKEQQQLGNPPLATFPPGLLAANPSLANAAPGSLVVVASPSTSGGPASNQNLLHVFRVTETSSEPEPSQNDKD